MAVDVDRDYQERLQGWRSFARLMRWAVFAVVVVLILLAYFLL